MKKTFVLIPLVLIVSALLVFMQVSRGLADSSDDKIKSAMSAGPMSIAKDATILDLNGTVLRKGTNDWTCYPDDPASPYVDPACYDKVFMVWNDAGIAKTVPKITGAGIGYMLAGGATVSVSDPNATAPLDSDKWMKEPPHIMLVLPQKLDSKAFPTVMTTGGPYIMFDGTPYEHLMIPVTDMSAMK